MGAMPERLTKAVIDLGNYKHNLAFVRRSVGPDTAIMAVVKANAYGHGMERIASAAVSAGASYIGVVSLGELKRIRSAGMSVPVLILNYTDEASLADTILNDGSITIMDRAIIAEAQSVAAKLDRRVKVHLKIDTGMHRAGCDPQDAVDLAKRVESSANLELEGIFTHFAEADEPGGKFMREQLAVFRDCLESIGQEGIEPPIIHCANGAAVLASPDTHFSMVRPGLITYGLNPFGPDHPRYGRARRNLRPVLSLKTQVVGMRRIQAGETVGYNRRWKAERTSTLAVLPVGYGDGWRRAPHGEGRVIIGGELAPIVGSISMDQTVIDITGIADVSVGDEAVLIGTQGDRTVTADDLAVSYRTINYEVVTSLSDRIVRQFEGGS